MSNCFFPGYFLSQDNQELPDLTSEERKKLGLVYYKPITEKLAEFLLQNQKVERNVAPPTIITAKPQYDFAPEENPLEQIKADIENDLQELENLAYEKSSTSTPSPIPTHIPRRVYEPNVRIDMPSRPLNLEEPFSDYDFKPILNPPPDFYKFKPVKTNPFNNDDVILSAPRVEPVDTLDQNLDTISAPYEQTSEPVLEYDTPFPVDYGVHHQEETHQYVEVPQPQYQDASPEYQAYQESPPEYQQERVQSKRARSDFLLKTAFSKVASLFDSLFYKG